jgi:hypothetical protein
MTPSTETTLAIAAAAALAGRSATAAPLSATSPSAAIMDDLTGGRGLLDLAELEIVSR